MCAPTSGGSSIGIRREMNCVLGGSRSVVRGGYVSTADGWKNRVKVKCDF